MPHAPEGVLLGSSEIFEASNLGQKRLKCRGAILDSYTDRRWDRDSFVREETAKHEAVLGVADRVFVSGAVGSCDSVGDGFVRTVGVPWGGFASSVGAGSVLSLKQPSAPPQTPNPDYSRGLTSLMNKGNVVLRGWSQCAGC
jgi:hypothetical protein